MTDLLVRNTATKNAHNEAQDAWKSFLKNQ
jgi:hypothetical protein